ncbi:MAG: PAS domain-containing protein [Paracoccaceae bacterium]
MADELTRDGTVVSISQAMQARRFAAPRRVEAYWHALRIGRTLPRRGDIDPRGIEDALEYAFIAERIAPGHARLRVAGMHLSDLVGMEARGMPLSTLIAAQGRRAFAETLEKVFAQPAIARLSLRAQAGFGRPDLEGQMLLLPLRSESGEVSRVLGCLETLGRMGRAPRRFTPSDISVAPLAADPASGAAPADGPKAPAPTPDRGFAESPRRLAGAPPRRAAHLRLIKTDGET